MSGSDVILSVEHLTMQFGGIVAVNDLSFEVCRGSVVALIGPNGAGKTTAFNCVTGVYEPTGGQVFFEGECIARNTPRSAKKDLPQAPAGKRVRTSPDRIAKLGISRTFQNIRLFNSMTVFDNVLVAKHMRARQNFLSAALRPGGASEKRMRLETSQLLEEQGIAHLADEMAVSLPYGIQRRLEIARALAGEPKLLLLDEPAAGMNPQETAELAEFISKIRDTHSLSILVIEHHMDLIMNISENIYVLDFGRCIAEGPPAAIQKDKRVIDAYLGVV